jgi:hypothetical protein
VAEFSKLEGMWNQAHLHSDADTLDRLWADNIVVIVPKMPPFSIRELRRGDGPASAVSYDGRSGLG